MKKIYVFTVVLLAMVFGFVSPVMAGGDKVFACHITYMLYTEAGDPARFEGHVISIAEKSVKAHCAHETYTDHRPGKRIGEAELFCADFFDPGDEGYGKCLTKFLVGMSCGRDVDNDIVVAHLCGEE